LFVTFLYYFNEQGLLFIVSARLVFSKNQSRFFTAQLQMLVIQQVYMKTSIDRDSEFSQLGIGNLRLIGPQDSLAQNEAVSRLPEMSQIMTGQRRLLKLDETKLHTIIVTIRLSGLYLARGFVAPLCHLPHTVKIAILVPFTVTGGEYA